ncbi:MAG: SdpI family protein [Bacteroidetes bacterium]|nr:SdpI family protein [Bacteroidota bacterium]
MKTLKKDWLTWIIILSPLVLIIGCWDKFPDQIPTHFGMNGQPDDYSGKAFGLLMLPAINVLTYLLFLVLPKIDPRGKNYKLFADKYKIIRIIFHAFFTFIFFLTAFYALGNHFNLSLIMFYGLLTLFLLLGNYIGNVRPNFFIGVRTAWTLSNEEVWVKTHRLTAKIWVFGSLIMMVILPFVPQPDYIILPFIIIISIIPIVYSYLIFRKIKSSNHEL